MRKDRKLPLKSPGNRLFKSKMSLNEFLGLEICVKAELALLLAAHDAHLLVLAHPLLEEVGFALQRNVLHEVEGVLDIVNLEGIDDKSLTDNFKSQLKLDFITIKN